MMTTSTKTDWSSIMRSENDVNVVKLFATGRLSRDNFYQAYANTEDGGKVRTLLRGGVSRAREIARKALRRRGVTV